MSIRGANKRPKVPPSLIFRNRALPLALRQSPRVCRRRERISRCRGRTRSLPRRPGKLRHPAWFRRRGSSPACRSHPNSRETAGSCSPVQSRAVWRTAPGTRERSFVGPQPRLHPAPHRDLVFPRRNPNGLGAAGGMPSPGGLFHFEAVISPTLPPPAVPIRFSNSGARFPNGRYRCRCYTLSGSSGTCPPVGSGPDPPSGRCFPGGCKRCSGRNNPGGGVASSGRFRQRF